MKNLHLGDISIPITQYASQGNAVLGIRDSGKSYSATYLAEQLYAAGIPFVAFDPSGVWKFLRVPGSGKGLPVVVAGGKSPDLPLTPQSAPEIVRAAMKANVSLVIDLYDIHLSKADWSRIVESCIRVLLYENGEHGLRHIFIEEGAEFAPQQITPDKAKVYAEVEKLARIGGNALLGYTLINQRAEQVNKAVLELCDCLFLHRQKGKNSLTSLSKWLDYSQSGDTKKIIQGLPMLPSGQCWVWPANADHATLVKMPQKNTFHPDRRALIANPAAANVKRVDATAFVTELKGSLEKHLQEVEANDPKLLKVRITELERTLKSSGAATNHDIATARKEGVEEGFQAARDEWNRQSAPHLRRHFESVFDTILKEVTNARHSVLSQFDVIAKSISGSNPVQRQNSSAFDAQEKLIPIRDHPLLKSSHEAKRNAALTGPEQRIVDAIAWLERTTDKYSHETAAVAFLAGYTIGGGAFNNPRGSLRTKGLINFQNGKMSLTEAGRELADCQDRPLSNEELHSRVLERLPGPEQKLLSELLKQYPGSLSNNDLAERAGYSPGGGAFNNPRGRLRTLGLIEYQSGLSKASACLFPV